MLSLVKTPAVVVEATPLTVGRKKRVAIEIITIDSDDSDESGEETPEQELARLRKENTAFKRIRLEPRVEMEGRLGDERKLKTERRETTIVIVDN